MDLGANLTTEEEFRRLAENVICWMIRNVDSTALDRFLNVCASLVSGIPTRPENLTANDAVELRRSLSLDKVQNCITKTGGAELLRTAAKCLQGAFTKTKNSNGQFGSDDDLSTNEWREFYKLEILWAYVIVRLLDFGANRTDLRDGEPTMHGEFYGFLCKDDPSKREWQLMVKRTGLHTLFRRSLLRADRTQLFNAIEQRDPALICHYMTMFESDDRNGKREITEMQVSFLQNHAGTNNREWCRAKKRFVWMFENRKSCTVGFLFFLKKSYHGSDVGILRCLNGDLLQTILRYYLDTELPAFMFPPKRTRETDPSDVPPSKRQRIIK